MSAENSQKIKLLKMMELLRHETDANHPITRIELCRRMEAEGISCATRTLSKDIEVFREFGYDVKSCQVGHNRGYYVDNDEFSIAELKILIDAVQAAGFITEERTEELIGKLSALGGSHKAELLRKGLVRFNTRKHRNESVYSTVEILEEALRKKRCASFCYFDLDEKKNRVFRRKHERYVVEPVALIYEDSYYYLVCHNTSPDKAGETAVYRVDRMDEAAIGQNTISAEARAQRRKLNGYTSRKIRMFGGKEETVTLEFDNSVIGAVYDKFGEEIVMRRISEDRCIATVTVEQSPPFRAWVYQFGDLMKVR